MGRTSAAAAAVPAPALPRPAPPASLTPAQAAEWKAIVGRLPATWFPREVRGLLELYVRHIDAALALSRAIDALPPDALTSANGFLRHESIAKARDREARAASLLATRLRLTPQSRFTPGAAATASKRAGSAPNKPWET